MKAEFKIWYNYRNPDNHPNIFITPILIESNGTDKAGLFQIVDIEKENLTTPIIPINIYEDETGEFVCINDWIIQAKDQHWILQ